jgi:membrane protease YdiL (CAAX protease family)
VSDLRELALATLAWLALAVVAGLPAAAVWWALRRRGEPVLMPDPPPTARWSAVAVFLAFAAYFLVPAGATAITAPPELLQRGGDKAATPRTLQRFELQAQALAFPFELALMTLLVRPGGGLWLRRPAAAALAAYLAWLMLLPLVFVIHTAVNVAYTLTFRDGPTSHPLLEFLSRGATSFDWTLAFTQAVIVAPVLEETLFRGVLLPYLLADRVRPAVASVLCLPLALVFGPPAWGIDRTSALLFALALVCGPGWVMRLDNAPALARWLPCRPAGVGDTALAPTPGHAAAAIWVSAALFAVMHSNVWPTPVPLFLLALGFGWLAYRTHSLVAPVVAHALFNAVSCITVAMERALADADVTRFERLQSGGILLLFAAIVAVAGWGLLRVIGRSSPARRLHGKFVLGGMVAGVLVGGFVSTFVIDNERFYPGETDAGLAGAGLLIGWLVGTVVGALAVRSAGDGAKETGTNATAPPDGV